MKKLVGALLCIVLGIPLVVGVTFAAGITGAVTDGTYMTRVSETAVERAPRMADDFFAAAREGDVIEDARERAWFQAMAETGTRPSEVMQQTGITAWLREHLAASMRDVDRVLRGEAPPGSVSLDMRPLKQALRSDEMRAWLLEVVAHLPACDQQGRQAWRAQAGDHGGDWPACNPGVDEGTDQVQVAALIAARVDEIPDQTPVFEGDDFPVAFDVPRTLGGLAWLLFLAPALLIVLGAALAGNGSRGFLRWSGGSALLGGLLALAFSLIAGGLVMALVESDPAGWGLGDQAAFWSSEAGRIAAEQVKDMMELFVGDLMSPVQRLALIVSGAGLGLLLLSWLAGRGRVEAV